MSQLTIVANIVAKQDKIELVKAQLLKLIDETRKEPGCIDYNLHQDIDNNAHFMMYETWQTKELWSQHTETEHLKTYSRAVEGAVESFTLSKMTLIK